MSMLEGAPWLLAHKSMLEVNKPRKISLYGKDYVLWKDNLGEVKALPNACPHMGAMLSEGWCQQGKDGASEIVCPFHALGFDGKGCTILPGTKKKTLPQLEPLELIVQGNLIWSYGNCKPQAQIPNILNEISSQYEFVGHIADISIETSLLSMLLNMHDYNHQNGTHRPLFKIEEVQFKSFRDHGHHSHALYNLPTAPATLAEKLHHPKLLLLPKIIEVHLENHFPSMVIFHGENLLGRIAQVNLFIPESTNRTRTYVLLYGLAKSFAFPVLKHKLLDFAKVITEQDADILGKIYSNTVPKMKLNNEVGMDWVRRNFENWPEIVESNLSKDKNLQANDFSNISR